MLIQILFAVLLSVGESPAAPPPTVIDSPAVQPVTIAGGKAEVLAYPKVAHIDIMLALAPALSGLAPTLQDTTHFIRQTSCP